MEIITIYTVKHTLSQTVIVTDVEEYNGEEVSFEAIYEYCSLSDEYLETEDMISGICQDSCREFPK
jgi:hypothetical protein